VDDEIFFGPILKVIEDNTKGPTMKKTKLSAASLIYMFLEHTYSNLICD
jgi:hypothetical protein